MKILSTSSLIFRTNNNIQKNSVAKGYNNTENKNVTNLNLMPNYSYLVNFGANNENLDTLYTHYSNGKGMPYTYEQIAGKMTSQERKNITDVYANYKSVYAKMEDCHTVEDLKREFPHEFKNIQSALTQDDSNGSFLTALNKQARVIADIDGAYMFPKTKDNDFSVYLAKKIYFEAKTKDEIIQDFPNDLNMDLLTPEDRENIKSTRGGKTTNELIPLSIYKKLGLVGDVNSNGFRQSLCVSRQEYIEKYGSIYKAIRKANFEKDVNAILDIDNASSDDLPKKNSARCEKTQYAMYYVWNNSLELRRTLSDFLLKNQAGNELLKPDFVKLKYSQAQTAQEENQPETQQSLMKRFWAENAELKEDFRQKCSDAFSIVEKAIDNGTFQDFKKQVDKDRQEIYLMLKDEKALKEYEFLKADLRQQEIDARIKKEKAEEEARIKRETDIKDGIKKDFMASGFSKTVPKSIQMEIIRQIQEIGLTAVSGEDYSAKAKIYAKKLDTATIIALHKTFYDLLKLTDNNKGQKTSKESPLEIFAKKINEKYDEINGAPTKELKYQRRIEIKEIASNSVDNFLINIFFEYVKQLNTAPTREIGKADRKKMINSLYTNFRTKYPMPENSKTAKLEDYAIKEYVKIITDKTPDQILKLYTKLFRTEIEKLRS